VPTTAELGLAGVEVENWYSMLAPAGTPPDRIARLSEAARGVLAPGGETARRFTEMGARIVAADPEAAGAFIRAEIAKWAEVVRRANIRPD
jgi:tripartite-type tricarboxylate transporter receptor subunit TctC